MTELPTITAARRALGRQLAELRCAANLTQSDLAGLVDFSRSTVANVEAGYQTSSPKFWRKCDEVLATDGTLRAALDELEEFARDIHRTAAKSAQGQRQEEIERWRRDIVTPTSNPARPIAAPAIAAALTSLRENHAEPDDLETRVLDAYQQQRNHATGPLSLILVGGFAGSGKSEFARFLSSVTGWSILDKDTISRALVERLLLANGEDINDRHTSFYQENIRPFEYRCLLDAAIENLRCGVSTVVTAPFIRELADGDWVTRLQHRCTAQSARLNVVWIKCDEQSMYDYIAFRGAARDNWKLNNWPDYLGTIEPEFEPPFQHHTVDNRLNAAVALADQAREIARRVQA